jgi:hypothetical protein
MNDKKLKKDYTPYAPTERDLEERSRTPTPDSAPGQCCGANPHNARSGQIHAGQAQLPQVPGGGGAPGTGATADADEQLSMSDEAKNQQATAAKSRADSGTP